MSDSFLGKLFGAGRHSRLLRKLSEQLQQEVTSYYYPSAYRVKRLITRLQKLTRSKYATKAQKDALVRLVTELTSTLGSRLRKEIDKNYQSKLIDEIILTVNSLLRSEFATDAVKASVLEMSSDLTEMHKDTVHSDTYEEEHAVCGSDYCAGHHSDFAGENWRPAKLDF
jgi:hypothetical protein